MNAATKDAKNSATKTPAAKIRQQKNLAEREQAQLQERLKKLKSELSKTQGQQEQTRDALQKSEAAISQTNRQLRALGEQQMQTRQRLNQLLEQREQVINEIHQERDRLATLVRSQYLGERASQWQLLLQGENPNRIQRNLIYLSYFGQAQAASITRLNTLSANLLQLASAQKIHQEELSALEKQELRQRQQLEVEKRERAQTLEKIARQAEQQKREVGVLERDAARMNGLVERLSQLIEKQLLEEQRKKAAQAKKKSEAKKSTTVKPNTRKNTTIETPKAPEETEDPSASDTGLATLRGKLKLPVRGDITGRFGQPRDNGQSTWKGIFIQAKPAAEVRVIAAGRVVFSDWLRGFGNLLIVDHGNSYLSIYGGNEALFRQAGQTVQAGEVVASVGNTLGLEQHGLYFELRFRGNPLDPLAWVK